MEPDRYAALYLAPFPAAKPVPSIAAEDLELSPRHFAAVAAEHAAPLSLHELYVAGALCGHA